MPIEIDGKIYRNLTEQVKKNMEDIKALQEGGAGGGVTKEYVDEQDEAVKAYVNEKDAALNLQINQVNTAVTALDNDVSDLSRSVSAKIDTEDGHAQGSFIIEPQPNETTSQLLINDDSGTGIQIVQDSNGASVDYDAAGIISASKSFMSKFQTESTYTPTANNNLTTKKYVDDAVAGASGGGVSKEYVDTQDATLQANIDKKVAQLTTTSGSYAYVRNGSRDDKIAINSLVGSDAIVRRTSTGQIKANDPLADNDCTTKKYVDDAVAGASGGGAQLDVANTWTAVQTFNAGIITDGTINISGQGSINIIGDISCDGDLTLAGGDILEGGTGNFSKLITSSSYIVDTSATATTGTAIEALELKYKQSSTVYTQKYSFARRNSNVNSIIISNKDINTNDFDWDALNNRLKLNVHIAYGDQTYYDNLQTKDKSTLYIITD